MVGWLLGKAINNPDRLLALLIRAQRVEDNEIRASIIFRAGMKVGLNHPEIARSVIYGPEAEYNI